MPTAADISVADTASARCGRKPLDFRLIQMEPGDEPKGTGSSREGKDAASLARAGGNADQQWPARYLRNEIRALELKVRKLEGQLRLRTLALQTLLLLSGVGTAAVVYVTAGPGVLPSSATMTPAVAPPAPARPDGPVRRNEDEPQALMPASPEHRAAPDRAAVAGASQAPSVDKARPPPVPPARAENVLEGIPPKTALVSPPPTVAAPSRSAGREPDQHSTDVGPPDLVLPVVKSSVQAAPPASISPDLRVGLANEVPAYVLVYFTQDDRSAERQAAAAAQRLRDAGVRVGALVPTTRQLTKPSISYFFASDQRGATTVERIFGGMLGTKRLIALSKDDPLPRPGTIVVSVPSAAR